MAFLWWNKLPSMGNLFHNLMTSALLSCFCCYFYELSFLSCHIHVIPLSLTDSLLPSCLYTTQTHDLCQHGERCQKKTDVCFCGNDTEQLLSPHTYSLLRLWWLWVAQLHINSVGSTSILGPVLNPWFLATCLLMTRPFLVGLQAVDGVSITDHRHLWQETVSKPEKL